MNKVMIGVIPYALQGNMEWLMIGEAIPELRYACNAARLPILLFIINSTL